MVVVNVISMNAGYGDTSYARNSLLQKTVMSKARPLLEETIKHMICANFPSCFKMADMGCSSGPNTFLVISEILDTIHGMCQQMKCKSPEFQVFLNDLPANDFNTIFESLPAFYERLKNDKGEKFGPCFISGMPGSFYGRLFPSGSLNFIHSSCSVHWLSKVPDGVENNKRNIYLAKSSPPNVFKSYFEQFQKDFSNFLSSRSEELIHGGRMVLTFLGRSIADPSSNDCCYIWEFLSKSLFDLVAEGLVEEGDVESMNMPIYTAYEEEVREIVKMEGSFNLDKLETFEVNWDANEDDVNNKNYVFDKFRSGQKVANCIRAATEPMLASQFGDTVIDNIFERYSKHVAEHLCVEKTKHFNIVITLTNK